MSVRSFLAARNRCALFLLILALAALAAPSPACAAAQADYVIAISVDGLGASYLAGLLYGNQLPNFQRLQAEGAWTLNARNDVDVTVTLPNHTTILTGRGVAGAAGHNWTSNSAPAANVTLAANKGSYVASAYDVAHDNGLSTALFTGKDKFILYPQSYGPATGAADATGPDNGRAKIDTYVYEPDTAALVAGFTAAMTAAPARFSLLHLADPDSVGHDSGWGTRAYNASLKAVDGYLGSVFSLIDSSPTLRGRTAVILTADHGGAGTDHSAAGEPLDYTIPFFAWGPGITADAGLYALNPAARLDPGTGRPAYTAAGQPVRNGDTANLALALLNLGPVPGSTINAAQNLRVDGAAPRSPKVIAFTAFNEAATDLAGWAPGAADAELGFSTASTPQVGTSPLAATYDSSTSPLRLRMRSVAATTTFNAVDLADYAQVAAAIDIQIKNTTYEADDFFRAVLTDGVDTITLAEAVGAALNALAKETWLHYEAAIPDGWATATLVVTSSTNSSSNAESVDFDNVYFTGLAPVPEPATLALLGLGALATALRRRAGK